MWKKSFCVALFITAIDLLFCNEESSSTTETEILTTLDEESSSAIGTEILTTLVDPCSSNPCPVNADCVRNGENLYKCLCSDGYEKYGGDCVKVCRDSTVDVSKDKICNAENCEELSEYISTAKTISIVFLTTFVGTTSVANTTCAAVCCGEERPIGFVECNGNGIFSVPSWINCSDVSPDDTEKLTYAVIETSNAEQVDDVAVRNNVMILKEVSEQNTIPEETANDFITVTNNLLRATGDGAAEEVESSVNEITQSVNEVAQKVVLQDNSDDYASYEKVQSDIAMAVVGPLTSTTTSRPYNDTIYYHGSSEFASHNLVEAELILSDVEVSRAWIKVEPESGYFGRISFVVYSNSQDLFPETSEGEIISKNIVYGVGIDGAAEFEMRFPIMQLLTVDGDNVFDDDKQLDCIRWTGSKWSSGFFCYSYSASDGYASCKCKVSGEYTIRSVTIDDALSLGAIAGIVVGSFVGIIIIFLVVGVCCCIVKEK